MLRGLACCELHGGQHVNNVVKLRAAVYSRLFRVNILRPAAYTVIRWSAFDTELLTMDAYSRIEKMVRDKYGKNATTRKAIGDSMLTDSHAVNVKSNNIAKQNYSPNLISIQRTHEWVFEQRHELSFVSVDYEEQDGKRISCGLREIQTEGGQEARKVRKEVRGPG